MVCRKTVSLVTGFETRTLSARAALLSIVHCVVQSDLFKFAAKENGGGKGGGETCLSTILIAVKF